MSHYFLDFLRGEVVGPEFEYRLACSGGFYNRRVETFDWRKSDVTRLLVVSRPFDAYPQELAARFRVGRVTERAGNATRIFVPDAEIAEDLSAMLSLLSRRLVSVVTKTREICANAPRWYEGEIPAPTIDHPRIVNWARRPATIITKVDGQEVRFNDPPPTGVDDLALGAFVVPGD
jgi:hypothetical protein